MAGLLISGPAGAGKSARARQVLEQHPGPAVLAEFQPLYAALLGIERLDSGRYPERLDRDAYAIPLAETTRRQIIAEGQRRGLYVVTTNSNGNPERRSSLLNLLGAGAAEEVIDPGLAVVRDRLAVDGVLSQQCAEALERWYGQSSV